MSDPINHPLIVDKVGSHGSGDVLLYADTNDPEFVRGFEAGKIWVMARMVATYGEPFDLGLNDILLPHIGEMLMRIAEATSTTITECEREGDWLRLEIKRRAEA